MQLVSKCNWWVVFFAVSFASTGLAQSESPAQGDDQHSDDNTTNPHGPSDHFGFVEAVDTSGLSPDSQIGAVKIDLGSPLTLPSDAMLKISGTDAPAAFLIRLGNCMSFSVDVSQLLLRLHNEGEDVPRIQFVYLLRRQGKELLTGPEMFNVHTEAEAYESQIWFRMNAEGDTPWRYFKSVVEPALHRQQGPSDVLDARSLDSAARDEYRCKFSAITLEQQRVFNTVFSNYLFDVSSFKKEAFAGLRVWSRGFPSFVMAMTKPGRLG